MSNALPKTDSLPNNFLNTSPSRRKSSSALKRFSEQDDPEDYSDVFSAKSIPMLTDDKEPHSSLFLNSKLSNDSWRAGSGESLSDEDDPLQRLTKNLILLISKLILRKISIRERAMK